MNNTPIFFDETTKRWRLIKTVAAVIAFLLVILFALFIVLLSSAPRLNDAPFFLKNSQHISIAPKHIALTFDDGPDAYYTPQILDILKQTNTHATFFVVGMNALLNPSLLRRELLEGHDIGNHTFTHAWLFGKSWRFIRMELLATERVLEHYLGRTTRLFRLPFVKTNEPEISTQIPGSQDLTPLGYAVIGMHIVGNDRLKSEAPTIVQTILNDIDKQKGNIILLHDAGGNRAQTIKALPTVIAELKTRGYQFVTVSELLGQTQAQVLPLHNENIIWKKLINEATLDILYVVIKGMIVLVLICVIYSLFQMTLLFALVGYQKFKTRKTVYPYQFQYSVAVIIPAYNEGQVILRTVDELLKAVHPKCFEVVVVNDGSTDNTWALLKANYEHHKLVKLITQPNQGKSAALNYGISHTQADIVVTIDADTIVSKMAIMELTSQFANTNVGAVAGNIKVGNRTNWLTKMQAVEYITNHNLLRRAFTQLNALMIVAGATGAWRRDLVVTLGGFPEDTLAEDEDLTLNIRKAGYSILFSDKAITYTEAPDTIKLYLKQRYRWVFGGLQAFWKHRDILFKPRYGWLGFIVFPSTLMGLLFVPIIGPLMDILLLGLVISWLFSPAPYMLGCSADTLMLIVGYYILFTVVEFLLGSVGFLLEPGEDKRLLWWLIPQRFFNRWALFYTAIKALHAALKGHAVGWDKFSRTATVNAPELQ